MQACATDDGRHAAADGRALRRRRDAASFLLALAGAGRLNQDRFLLFMYFMKMVVKGETLPAVPLADAVAEHILGHPIADARDDEYDGDSPPHGDQPQRAQEWAQDGLHEKHSGMRAPARSRVHAPNELAVVALVAGAREKAATPAVASVDEEEEEDERVQVEQLVSMGFRREEAVTALAQCGGDVDAALNLLLQPATRARLRPGTHARCALHACDACDGLWGGRGSAPRSGRRQGARAGAASGAAALRRAATTATATAMATTPAPTPPLAAAAAAA
eukprot:scaffold1793_cov399-Prasinococcus_capsulatus_cf.AAC.9